MSIFSVLIENIQHVKRLDFQVDLSLSRLICLTGRNGVGKTTLVRAFRNLSNADTFQKTAGPLIFNNESRITYQLDEDRIEFSYDKKIRSINCRQDIPDLMRKLVLAELPIPHGARFNYFRSAGDVDNEIRQAIIIENFLRPDELIDFLRTIYTSNRFDNLVEINVKERLYYCLKLDDNYYLREDYLSSGEYFLINLYRTIKSGAGLVVIDEIDISLDAAAQAKIISWLRKFCSKYNCSIVFTTHSLAVMKSLDDSELFFMNFENGVVSTELASYSYIKSRLFGYKGWDKYILTEDKMLNEFIEFLISKYFSTTFFEYKIIHVGAGSQVIDLLQRNSIENFLAEPSNVIAILDGDRRSLLRNQNAEQILPAIHLLPFDDVEKAFYFHRTEDEFPFEFDKTRAFTGERDFYNFMLKTGKATSEQINSFLVIKYQNEIQALIETLRTFLMNENNEAK